MFQDLGIIGRVSIHFFPSLTLFEKLMMWHFWEFASGEGTLTVQLGRELQEFDSNIMGE